MDDMKKYTIIAAAAAALLSVGCAKEQTLPEQGTVLKASLSALTKASIDGVKVSWSEGDAITVNGSKSSALAEAAATAEFEFRSALTAPYKAVYPSSIYKNETTVTLPGILDAETFNIALGGYTESGDEISFQALTAFLKISLTGAETTTLRDITLKGLGGEQLCGDFTISYPALTLAGASSAEADQVVKVSVNKALSATPLVVYIPIPAGSYASGYQVEFTDVDGKIMRQSVSARTVKAGELREMPALAYEPNVAEDPNIGGIPDAKELADFAAAVNEGHSISRWINNSTGAVELLADIDLGGADWTPIGNGSVTTAHAITGAAFTGVFDGKGHTVDNFKVSIPASGANVAGGLFGVVSGATLKNLTIGDKAVIKTSSNSGFVTLGGVVGFAGESTLENLDSKALLANDAGKNGTRLVLGGTVGTLFASETVAATATSLNGHASFSVTNSVNTNNGASGISVGGVIGLMDGKDVANAPAKAVNCTNYSSFEVEATRTGGVIGTMNTNCLAENCVNNGNISCKDVKASNSRVAGIVSAMGNNTAIKGCINYGDICFTIAGDKTHGYAAGLVGQTNDGNSFTYIDGCATYGTIQSDRWFADGDDKYMGIVCGNFNAKVISVKNCVVGGKIGPFVPTGEAPLVTITAENFATYYSLTAASRIEKVVFENNSFGTRP